MVENFKKNNYDMEITWMWMIYHWFDVNDLNVLVIVKTSWTTFSYVKIKICETLLYIIKNFMYVQVYDS